MQKQIGCWLTWNKKLGFLLDDILVDTMVISLYKLFEQVFEIFGYANSERNLANFKENRTKIWKWLPPKKC